MDGATQMLKRAVELEKSENYSEAKVCYEEGIELLIKVLPTLTDENLKAQIRVKVSSYMKRAEELKEHLKNNSPISKFHTTIKIKNNQIGCSYSTLFSKYVDDKLTFVTVQDAYIRNHRQILNFLRFCELLIKKGKAIKTIMLFTSRDENNPAEQEGKLLEIKSSLGSFGVTMKYEYSSTLHDREITFDNGWIIKIGRGLDYFKAPKGKMSLGFCDFDLRECHETNIDIYTTK